MLQFAGMNPSNQELNSKYNNIDSKKKENLSSWLVTIISVALFILFALGVIIFLFNQNQALKKKLADYQNTSSPTPSTMSTSTPSADLPTISSPIFGAKIESPLKIAGQVPSGWMFEGTFPIKLLDSEKNIIVQGTATEVIPGSWQSESIIDFTATLTFKDASGTGTLVLENDNPSGNPENSKTFGIPITY